MRLPRREPRIEVIAELPVEVERTKRWDRRGAGRRVDRHQKTAWPARRVKRPGPRVTASTRVRKPGRLAQVRHGEAAFGLFSPSAIR
jgi:hypothetical protein